MFTTVGPISVEKNVEKKVVQYHSGPERPTAAHERFLGPSPRRGTHFWAACEPPTASFVVQGARARHRNLKLLKVGHGWPGPAGESGVTPDAKVTRSAEPAGAASSEEAGGLAPMRLNSNFSAAAGQAEMSDQNR